MSKGQVSLEYMLLTGFLLLAVSAIFLFVSFSLSAQRDLDATSSAVNSLVKCIDQVYALGPGSDVFVDVKLPFSVVNQQIEKGVVSFTGQNQNYFSPFLETRSLSTNLYSNLGSPGFRGHMPQLSGIAQKFRFFGFHDCSRSRIPERYSSLYCFPNS